MKYAAVYFDASFRVVARAVQIEEGLDVFRDLIECTYGSKIEMIKHVQTTQAPTELILVDWYDSEIERMFSKTVSKFKFESGVAHE